ncbi:MAG: GNAT family N-acetyltransferase [Rubrivivax sp.]
MQLRAGIPDDAVAIAGRIASFQPELTDDPAGAGAERYLASVSCRAERSYLESSRYSYIVADQDGTILGFIALRDLSHVFHLFVARRHQRLGIARLLWQEAKARALATARPGAFTVNASLRAVSAYRSFGFAPVGEVVSVHGISFLPMRLAVPENEA